MQAHDIAISQASLDAAGHWWRFSWDLAVTFNRCIPWHPHLHPIIPHLHLVYSILLYPPICLSTRVYRRLSSIDLRSSTSEENLSSQACSSGLTLVAKERKFWTSQHLSFFNNFHKRSMDIHKSQPFWSEGGVNWWTDRFFFPLILQMRFQ